MQALPDDVLRTQVCQECFGYLSVNPVALNRRGEKICGRCNDSGDSISLFNVISNGFLFKCINHFNGCKELLSFEEVEEHEELCFYAPQECFFCSFSGNLSQILNHSMKYHPDTVIFDGIISFSLYEESSKRKLFVSDDNILLITINITEDLFAVLIEPQTNKEAPMLNQYEIKFFKSCEPSNYDFIHTEFGFCHNNFISSFEKRKDQLASLFGNGSILCCQIRVGQFCVEKREFEVQKRFTQVRSEEQEVVSVYAKLKAERQELCQKLESYDVATNVIKVISLQLFKCMTCFAMYPKEIYFCPEMHCYCKNCLRSLCEKCQATVEFKRQIELESFELTCDFLQCNRAFKLNDYFTHRPVCRARPYKCPLLNCNELLLSADKFIEHWHCDRPLLHLEETFTCEDYTTEEFYWLLKGNLYRVMIRFDVTWVQVIIEDVNVLPNTNVFRCDWYSCSRGWYKIDTLKFCGKFKITTSNSSTKLKLYVEHTL